MYSYLQLLFRSSSELNSLLGLNQLILLNGVWIYYNFCVRLVAVDGRMDVILMNYKIKIRCIKTHYESALYPLSHATTISPSLSKEGYLTRRKSRGKTSARLIKDLSKLLTDG